MKGYFIVSGVSHLASAKEKCKCTSYSTILSYLESLSLPLGFRNLVFMDIIIWLGYVWIFFLLIKTVKKMSPKSQEKTYYLSARQKRDLANKKQFLRLVGPVMVILAVLACIGIWFLFGHLPRHLVHLMILMTLCLVIRYISISLEERLSRGPSYVDEISRKYEKLRYDGVFKKLWFVNAFLLLLFCIVYTQVKSFPFHGIWGVLAWAITLSTVYSPAAIFHIETFRELVIQKERRFYVLSILLSWVMALFWLTFGEHLT